MAQNSIPLVPRGAPSAPEVSAELERVFASAEFRKSSRMCRFLGLVTQEALNGNAATLKEYRIGTEVFDKDESFDPRLDPIVRNEARRLRRKLEIYYLVEGKSDTVLIELPKGSYIPVFTSRNFPIIDTPTKPAITALSKWRVTWAGLVAAVALAAWWIIGSNWTSMDLSRAVSRSVSIRPKPIAASAEAYALGRHLLFNLRAQDVLASRSQLETAVRLDPAFAEAFAALALNYQFSVVLSLSPRDVGLSKSREMVSKAAKLAPDSAAAELALASQSSLLEEDYPASERHFERALAIDPNDAVARAEYAITCLLQLGKLDSARLEARKASELGQNGLTAFAQVLTDYCKRDYQSAIAHAHEALKRQPDSESLPGVLIDSYLASRKFEEAWFFIEKSRFDLDGYRALIRALRGHKDVALHLAGERAGANAQPVVEARLFAAGGDAASAIYWLERADHRHDFIARIYARYSSEFDAMRLSPAFVPLLTAMSKPRQP